MKSGASRRQLVAGAMTGSAAFALNSAAAQSPIGPKSISASNEREGLKSFASLAALRGQSFDQSPNVMLTGYEKSGDGGGGVFVLAPEDTTSHDNDVTVVVDSAGRRWRRVYSGPIDVRWAGAKCDGSSDDSAAIGQAASIGPIVFSAGASLVESSLIVAASVTIDRGALISPVAGVTLAFDGGFQAPVARVFRGAGSVVFNPAITTVGHPEWWGATSYAADVSNPPVNAVDSAAAIQACIDACQTTQLQGAVYYIGARLNVAIAGRTVRGVSATQVLSPATSQVVITNGWTSGFLIGIDAPGQPGTLIDHITLEDFTVTRATTIQNPISGVTPCPTGLSFKWCVNLQVNRVTVLEHGIGFYIYGCVESYWNNCSALRNRAGAHPENDKFSGFYLDYTAPLSANGGNASIYANRCRAFSNVGQGGTYAYAAGLTTLGGFVDLFVSQFETGLLQFGMDLQGDGYGVGGFKTEDLSINNCVLDSNTVAGIRVQNAGEYAAVQILGGYIAVAESSARAIDVSNVGGVVNVTGVQMIGGGIGVAATNAAVVNLSQNIYNDIPRPVVFQNVSFFDVCDTAHKLTVPQPVYPAASFTGCSRGRVALSVSGPTGIYECGVAVDSTSSHLEINATKLEPSAFAGGVAAKIFHDGAPWGGGATFGSGCLATGVLG